MNRDTTTYFLNLGDLGEDYEAEVIFNWYRPRVLREDDYPELEIEHVYVMFNGTKVDVVSLVTEHTIEYIQDKCWESVEE